MRRRYIDPSVFGLVALLVVAPLGLVTIAQSGHASTEPRVRDLCDRFA